MYSEFVKLMGREGGIWLNPEGGGIKKNYQKQPKISKTLIFRSQIWPCWCTIGPPKWLLFQIKSFIDRVEYILCTQFCSQTADCSTNNHMIMRHHYICQIVIIQHDSHSCKPFFCWQFVNWRKWLWQVVIYISSLYKAVIMTDTFWTWIWIVNVVLELSPLEKWFADFTKGIV